MAWRDISVRYKQTVIGAAWALIRPFLTMVVFTVIFGKLAKLPSDGTAPYALMVFAGMLPWSFFATALSDASNSLISNANLISKVYFPRLIVPMAAVVVAFIDFLIGFAILVASDDLVRSSCRVGRFCCCRFSPRLRSLRASALGYGSRRSTSNTGISVMSFHSSCSSGFMSLRSDTAPGSSLTSGGSPIRSIRWSGSLTASAGVSLAAKARSIGPVLAQPRYRRVFSLAWYPAVPENGKNFRRSYLIDATLNVLYRHISREPIQTLPGWPSIWRARALHGVARRHRLAKRATSPVRRSMHSAGGRSFRATRSRNSGR